MQGTVFSLLADTSLCYLNMKSRICHVYQKIGEVNPTKFLFTDPFRVLGVGGGSQVQANIDERRNGLQYIQLSCKRCL